MRFGEYKDALRLIERYPLLGVGFVGTPDNDLYVGVSSMYLLILSQMGLLGLGAFAATMLTFVASGARAYTANRLNSTWRASPKAGIAMGAYASVIAALFTGIFDHYFFNFDFHNSVTLFWFMVALGIAALPEGDHLGGVRNAPSA
jgi:O-antigen ligase